MHFTKNQPQLVKFYITQLKNNDNKNVEMHQIFNVYF